MAIQGAPGFPLAQRSTWAAVSQQEVRLPWHSISMATLASETRSRNCWCGEASSRILICPVPVTPTASQYLSRYPKS